MEIRELLADDAEAFRAVRLRALREETRAFLSSHDEEAARTLEEVVAWLTPRDGSFVLGGFVDGALVGLVGFVRKRHPKERHNGLVWGMYVDPDQRGIGLGRALLLASLGRARALDGLETVHLAVGETNAPARGLYESLGFEVWGVEPDAFRVGGESVTEAHMRLEL